MDLDFIRALAVLVGGAVVGLLGGALRRTLRSLDEGFSENALDHDKINSRMNFTEATNNALNVRLSVLERDVKMGYRVRSRSDES